MKRIVPFSVAVAVAYGATVALYEALTPWWAGDHIGFSVGSVLIYALGGLMLVGVADGVFLAAGQALEEFIRPTAPLRWRRRVFATLMVLGIAAAPLWIGVVVLEGWLRQR